MKEIIAVIRMDRMNRTKKALTEAGVDAFFAQECQGRGKGLVNSQLLEGAESGIEEAAEMLGEKGRLYPKRMVTVVVADDEVGDVVETIIETNRTGRPGDGKVFVMDIPDAARVRTGETGTKSIQ
ncbi:P-II family nitrogen regulator [Desulfohalovibrio reitneri]|uniref:P-II family nitrogen regulator n=1 Tax=Desulfohalovibrio reitneri TaxID=1307759 RepID=UPI0004A71941|nr:P-II family nitrogen regulator [Desulfohalovibrio reitneri]